MSIVPAADSYHHNTVLKDLSARIIVAGVVGFCSHLTVYRDFEWSNDSMRRINRKWIDECNEIHICSQVAG